MLYSVVVFALALVDLILNGDALNGIVGIVFSLSALGLDYSGIDIARFVLLAHHKFLMFVARPRLPLRTFFDARHQRFQLLVSSMYRFQLPSFHEFTRGAAALAVTDILDSIVPALEAGPQQHVDIAFLYAVGATLLAVVIIALITVLFVYCCKKARKKLSLHKESVVDRSETESTTAATYEDKLRTFGVLVGPQFITWS